MIKKKGNLKKSMSYIYDNVKHRYLILLVFH